MSLVALDGTPLVIVGGMNREGNQYQAAITSTLLDAAKESCMMIGQVYTEDMGSHTINTTGSSSIGWRTGAVTSANAGTTVVVGIGAVDMTAGPPGRAVNVADVITFDVSRTYTGASLFTASTWIESVPTAGTKTIAHGDLVALSIQMTALGGADLVNVATGSVAGVPVRPFVTNFVGGAYAQASSVPNAVITFSDGTLGFFYGSVVYSTPSTLQSYNNTSPTKEYGNYFLLPVPGKVYGLAVNIAVLGDLDAVLYSDPLGTPVAEKTVSFDLNAVGNTGTARWTIALFTTPYSFTANQPLAGIIKPTTATNISAVYETFNAAAHQKAYTLGSNCYAINRNTGAFAAQNSNKDRFGVGLIIGAWEVGGGSGISRARAQGGF